MEKYYSEKYDFDLYRDNGKAARSSAASLKQRPKKQSEFRRNSSRTASGRERQSAQPNRARRRPPKKKMTKGRKALAALVSVIIIGVIAATACVVGFNMYRDYKKAQPFRFSGNVKVGGISIGGLSYEEAAAKLKENSMYIVKSFKINVAANEEEKSFNKYDFDFKFNFKTPLKDAEIYSRKKQDIYDEPESTSTEPEPTAATETDGDAVNFKVDYSVREESVRNKVAQLGKIVDSDPVDAAITAFHPFSGKRFSYKSGEDGYRLNQEALVEDILEVISKGKTKKNITADVETLKPEITVKKLKKKIVGLSAATSTSYNNKNANTNMKVALKACNGSIIKPGETWSFNDHTGDSNLKSNGYKKATVIVNGKLEEGVGGGICQASTTIFKAALFANAAIIERNNHFWASDYAYAGEDATIDYPNLDLRFQNTTSYPMFLECKMEGTVLTANIWGVQEDYYDNVKVTSENYDIIKKDSYRTVTKRYLYLDGEVVNEEEVCYSFYSLKDNHSIRDNDKGSFRTMVNGYTKGEVEKKHKKTESTEDE